MASAGAAIVVAMAALQTIVGRTPRTEAKSSVVVATLLLLLLLFQKTGHFLALHVAALTLRARFLLLHFLAVLLQRWHCRHLTRMMTKLRRAKDCRGGLSHPPGLEKQATAPVR